MSGSDEGFGIGQVAELTGLGEGTLRMWESRHGFPDPERLANGRRLYSRENIEQINAVIRARGEGLSLPAAIETTRRLTGQRRLSVFRTLRQRFSHLHPRPMEKQALLWLSRAIEDECAARAEHPLLLGCFQREHFFRQSEHRWRSLARGARATVALAELPAFKEPTDAPVEVPLEAGDPQLAEWAVICHDRDLQVCMVARERPGDPADRCFEAIWTVEPEVVREAARVCLELVARSAPELASELLALVTGPARTVVPADLQCALDLATRVTGYATGAPDA